MRDNHILVGCYLKVMTLIYIIVKGWDFMKKRDEICFNNTDPLKAIFLVLRFAVEYYSQANLKTHQRRLIKKRKILL